jgi:hypothetical protein
MAMMPHKEGAFVGTYKDSSAIPYIKHERIMRNPQPSVRPWRSIGGWTFYKIFHQIRHKRSLQKSSSKCVFFVKIHSFADTGEISTYRWTATLVLVKIGAVKGMLYLEASTKFCLLFSTLFVRLDAFRYRKKSNDGEFHENWGSETHT